MTVRIGTLRQSLQMDTHVLLIREVAGVNLQVVQSIAVLVSLDNGLITIPVCLHPLQCCLVVGDVVCYGLVSEFAVGNTLAVYLALTLQSAMITLFIVSFIKVNYLMLNEQFLSF